MSVEHAIHLKLRCMTNSTLLYSASLFLFTCSLNQHATNHTTPSPPTSPRTSESRLNRHTMAFHLGTHNTAD